MAAWGVPLLIPRASPKKSPFIFLGGESAPDLTPTLDILIDNDQPFTEERNTEIHGKFFSREDESANLSEAAAGAIPRDMRQVRPGLGRPEAALRSGSG